jgi:pyruvate dehydrogenase E1 component alpha subunit
MPGLQVDGNDILAVYSAMKESVERARRGEGPTFLELLTYRISDHTTSDDAAKYRNPEEVKKWEPKDPIIRLQKFFQKNGMWQDSYGAWVETEVAREIEDAVQRGLAIPPPGPEELFDHIFANMTPDLQEQKQRAIELANEKRGAQ